MTILCLTSGRGMGQEIDAGLLFGVRVNAHLSGCRANVRLQDATLLLGDGDFREHRQTICPCLSAMRSLNQ